MKKLFLFILALLPIYLMAQSIVGTEPQNKNVVLEQYTGVNCPWCPDGTSIANSIYNANPDRVVVISVHTGSFANPGAGQPDFRTPFGPGLLGQTGITGFPAGTVNRHVFPGFEMTEGGTGMGRGYWTNASNQILEQSAYVNVAAEASIDAETREVTVYVEAYYTADSPENTNKINIALLQDKTYGFQAGGSSDYEHNNRLVHLITGQWGADITETAAGSLYQETFTYTIPMDYNDIAVELSNMRIAAFVTESNQEIINGVQVSPSLTDIPEFEFAIAGHNTDTELWSGNITPVFMLKSLCEELTDLNIEYSVNGEAIQTYQWEGSLAYDQTEMVSLPEISFELLPENELVINITDEDNSPENNSITIMLYSAPETFNSNLIVEIKTDQYGTETTWVIENEAGTTVASGGPYTDAVNTHSHPVELPQDNYIFKLYDSYGDGILGGGYGRILDAENHLVNIPGNSFTSFASRKFIVEEESPTQTFANTENDITIYPNPASNKVYIQTHKKETQIRLFDMTGQLVIHTHSASGLTTLNIEELPSGIYLIEITSEFASERRKLLIK